ncbi:hypothetical protein EDM60_07790 [Brevibacillus parabrevis]|nr:hypothetical protein EDM60_07790 [Brevibacillus parabrevis]
MTGAKAERTRIDQAGQEFAPDPFCFLQEAWQYMRCHPKLLVARMFLLARIFAPAIKEEAPATGREKGQHRG